MKRDYIQREIVGMPDCTLHIWKDHWKITYRDIEIMNEKIEPYIRELLNSAENYFNNIGQNSDGQMTTGDFRIGHEELKEIRIVGVIKGIQDVEVHIEIIKTGEKINCGRMLKLKDSWSTVEGIVGQVWSIFRQNI